MINIFIDFETTGRNAHTCEIVEIYAESDTASFHRLVKPQVWSIEAQQVHGIHQSQCDTSIEDALRDFCMWLPRRDFSFVCYANPNVFESGTSNQGYFIYDIAVLKMAFFRLGQYYWFMSHYKYEVINVYTLVRKCYNEGIIDVYENEGLSKFSQQNVANSLGIYYNSHRADEDVKALRQIYDYCIRATGNSDSSMGQGDGSSQGSLKLC